MARPSRPDRSVGARVRHVVIRVDRFQQRHPVLGFPIAVGKKSSDDRTGDLAAVIALYGFFSLFPLLVLLTSILGFVFENDPELQQQVLDEVLSQFPDESGAIEDAIGGLRGNGVALVLGAVGALWAGLAALRACQSAMDTLWAVPRKVRPNAAMVTLKSLGVLVIAMVGVLGSLTMSSASAFVNGFPLVAHVSSIVFPLTLLTIVFLLVYKVLPDRSLGWLELLPGAATAAVGWLALERLGTFLLSRSFRTISPTSIFIVALGLLTWMLFQARIVVTAAQVNAVSVLDLWPRSLTGDPLNDADRRALERYAEVETRVDGEEVSVRFSPPARRDSAWTRRRRLRRAAAKESADAGRR